MGNRVTRHFKITFCQPQARDEESYLEWELLQHEGVECWLESLSQCLKHERQLFSRFVGFYQGPRQMPFLAQELNRCIEVINAHPGYHIKERAGTQFTQHFANLMHHHFEVMTGPVWQESEYYKRAGKSLKAAICAVNHFIHEMESLTRAQEVARQNPEAVMAAVLTEFFSAPRVELPEQVRKYFTLDTDFGDLLLHYSQIGKTWWEVFLDQDEEIFPQAILPLRQINGEFDIFFGENRLDQTTREKFETFLKKHGQDPHDPKLGLGFVPLGKLLYPQGKKRVQIHRELGQHMDIKRILVQEGTREMMGREYPPRQEYYFDLG